MEIKVVYTGTIDAFYQYRFGNLEYLTETNVIFGGRLGENKDYDMDGVVENVLKTIKAIKS